MLKNHSYKSLKTIKTSSRYKNLTTIILKITINNHKLVKIRLSKYTVYKGKDRVNKWVKRMQTKKNLDTSSK